MYIYILYNIQIQTHTHTHTDTGLRHSSMDTQFKRRPRIYAHTHIYYITYRYKQTHARTHIYTQDFVTVQWTLNSSDDLADWTAEIINSEAVTGNSSGDTGSHQTKIEDVPDSWEDETESTHEGVHI